jgi:hypothetical protein
MRRHLLLICAAFLFSIPALAQTQYRQPYQNDASSYDIVSGCTTVDQCMWSSSGSGGTVQGCKRSVCWICDWHPNSYPQTQCGQSNENNTQLGCDCGQDGPNGECALKNGTCTIG